MKTDQECVENFFKSIPIGIIDSAGMEMYWKKDIEPALLTTLKAVREESYKRGCVDGIIYGFQESAEGYNYEYWGAGEVDDVIDEIIEQGLETLTPNN